MLRIVWVAATAIQLGKIAVCEVNCFCVARSVF